MAVDDLERRLTANAYRASIIENVEHDNATINVKSREQAQAYQQEMRALDREEEFLKQRYDENDCESQTGLSADGFRHQVISDYTQEQMAAQEQDAQTAQSYWDENQGDAVSEGDAQEATDQYWNSQSSVENGITVVEDGNQSSASNESSATSDMSAGADNSVSNENSI